MKKGMKVLNQESGRDWCLWHGDSTEVMRGIPDKSTHLSVFSPPFCSLFTYSASDRDLGNTKDLREFMRHFRFIVAELRRVMVPGRAICVHLQDLLATVNSNGYRGIMDFTGPVIRLFQRSGLIYTGRVTIWKNPQKAAARNKVHELMFVTKHRDAAALRPVMPDYLLLFRAPGENPIPIHDPIDNETWIEWASAVWFDIRETAVLNTAIARGSEDERHMCPLQLPVIERCVRLWTNPGETVFSPFAGIGSEGVESLRNGRRFVGIELKREYFEVAARNLQRAEIATRPMDLFSEAATDILEAVPA